MLTAGKGCDTLLGEDKVTDIIDTQEEENFLTDNSDIGMDKVNALAEFTNTLGS